MEETKKNWKVTANSRLNIELAGLSFALKKGHSHEEYAQHLWGEGANRWIKDDKPTPREYVKRCISQHEDRHPCSACLPVPKADRDWQIQATDGFANPSGAA